jgi:GT2 family glycosyltransferase
MALVQPGAPVAFSIVIANWNGETFLARCLSSALIAGRQAGGDFEIIVVDDASTDGGPEMVRAQFPQAQLIARDVNRGFAHTVNEGVEAARGRIVVLLNNDMVVRPDFCRVLLAHFESGDDRLFGVTAKTMQWDGHQPNFVKMDAIWRRGELRLVWSDPPGPQPTLFLQAGACAIVRERFLELGGLEALYAPGYWEDFDLSWRAMARGWRHLYDPSSPALHLGKASFRSRFGDSLLRQLVERNAWLFVWMNLDDPRLLASHCAWLPLRIGREIARGRIDGLRSFVKALRKIAGVLRARRRRARWRTVSDEAILRSVDTTGSRLSEP